MTQGKQDLNPIPPMTGLVAKSAFPKGNVYMTMRDQLGVLYRDSDLAALFSPQYWSSAPVARTIGSDHAQAIC